jgi:hypothetical protein
MLFVTVLAEARLWGLPDRKPSRYCRRPRRCLRRLRTATGDQGFCPARCPVAPL